MSSNTPINAAPMALLLGIQDLSTVAPEVAAEEIPTHLPKVYLYAKKGIANKGQLVVGGALTQVFGTETFDVRSKYATHATVLANELNAKANAQMIERVLPVDAGPKANLLLSLDVLPMEVPQYQRASDGTYLLSPVTNKPIPVVPAATVPGFKCKWVVSHITAGGPGQSDGTTFGIAAVGPGDQVDGLVTSTRYPFVQFWASSYGSYGNDAGFRISAPSTNSDAPVNLSAMADMKAYPLRISAINRLNGNSTAKISPTLAGEPFVDFVMAPGAIWTATDQAMDLTTKLAKAYQQVNIPGYVDVMADLGNFHIYQANIDMLMAQFYAAEKTFTGMGSDFSASASDEMWKFNPISGKSSTSAPYYSFAISDEDLNAVTLSENTNLFAAGGSDGTMSESLFAGLVATAVSEYANPLSPLQDTAVNVESCMYDTGFPLATKLAMVSFITLRKDTFVSLCTYDTQGGELTASDEAAIGLALKNKLLSSPESSYFGTPVVRGLVMARYGRLIGSNYPRKLPILIELASKSAKFMGAGNGVWKPEYLFDIAPNSELELFADVNITYTPGTQKNIDWANGLNYPISFSRSKLSFPALKTVYSDDSSILTNYFNAMVAIQCEKVGLQVWREFTGNVSLDPGVLVDRVNRSITDKTTGKFAGLVKIVPEAFISGGDAKRGYSWSMPIKMYGNVSTTVAILSLQAFRMSALAG